MPCYDERPSAEAEENKKRLDILTAFLCSIMPAVLESEMPIPQEIAEWYDNHLEFDKKRRDKN